jgi:hypothetical protein
MTEYIVKKTLEVIYTIDAETEIEAVNLANTMGLDEADQFSVYEIEVESINEYEESVK